MLLRSDQPRTSQRLPAVLSRLVFRWSVSSHFFVDWHSVEQLHYWIPDQREQLSSSPGQRSCRIRCHHLPASLSLPLVALWTRRCVRLLSPCLWRLSAAQRFQLQLWRERLPLARVPALLRAAFSQPLRADAPVALYTPAQRLRLDAALLLAPSAGRLGVVHRSSRRFALALLQSPGAKVPPAVE